MKLSKEIMLAGVVGVAAIGSFLTILRSDQTPTISGFEDSSGRVYECSRPIKAKRGIAYGLLSSQQGLVPASQHDIDKYCQTFGVE